MTDPRYWLSEPGGTPQGPYELRHVRAIAAAGKVSPRAVVCAESTTEWVPIAGVLGAVPAGGPPAPPPPPPPRPQPGAATAASAEDQALGYMLPIGADPMAIAASYLGLFGLVIWPLALVALLLGILAFRRRSRYPHPANRARCVVSIVLGALGVLAGTAVLVAVLLSR